MQRQNTRISLEIRKGKKVSCVPRDSQLLVLKVPLKTVHRTRAADLHGCAGICPLPICCSPISDCPSKYPFPGASYSTHFSTFPIPSTSCPLAPDLISASVPPILHPLPCSTPSPSLPLPIHSQALLTPLSPLIFLHPTSPPQQPRGAEIRGKQEGKMGIPQDR